MRKHSHLFSGPGLVLLAGAISFSGAAFAQSGTVPDAQVEANVLRALAGAPQLATQSIKTTTVYGTVTLSGTVTDEASRTLAENLASKAAGVQKVVDELTLSSDPAPDQAQQAATQDAGSTPMLQSDGTMAPAQDANQAGGQQAQPQPAYPQQGQQAPYPPNAQQAPYPPNGQQGGQYPQSGAVDPRYGPAGPPPDMQGGQNGQAAPPVYRQPYYRGAPPYGYAQQQAAPPPYGAQEAGKAVTIPSGALVRIRLVEGLTAKRIKAGTIFDATVLNDVIADGEVAIPRGASVQGTIVQSNSSGAVGGKGQLALQLTSVSLSGKNYPIVSDTWTHYGRDKTGQTVGSAVGLGAFGALIGAVAGGGAGAAIGAAAGGAAGIGASAASGRNDVVIPAEAIISFHLTQPAGVVTVSQAEMDRLGYGVQQSSLQRRVPPPPPPGYYGRPVYYPYAY
jgi:hypothetical protein